MLESFFSNNQISDQYTPEKQQNGISVHCWKCWSGKKMFLLEKKICESKLLKRVKFWTTFLYDASYFESRISNASDLGPFFFNSTIFGSKFSESVRFRKQKFYNASDFEVKLICDKTYFDESFALGKSVLEICTPKKRQLLQLCVFSKTNNCLKSWKKTAILSRLLKRISFWNKFLTTRQIWFKSFKISQFLVNFR